MICINFTLNVHFFVVFVNSSPQNLRKATELGKKKLNMNLGKHEEDVAVAAVTISNSVVDLLSGMVNRVLLLLNVVSTFCL